MIGIAPAAEAKVDNRLLRLIRSIPAARRRDWELRGNRVIVIVGAGQRRQEIKIVEDGDKYVLTSRVLRGARIRRSPKWRRRVAQLSWERNAELQLVGFAFDDLDQLVGRIEHPAQHLDPEELEIYINALARECDQFEYQLTGEDRY